MARIPAQYFTDAGQPSFSTEVRIGQWAREFAFGTLEPRALIYRAPFEQLDNAYTRPSDQNLANYNVLGRTAYFCDDAAFDDKGANIVTWTREVRTLPANHNTYETYSYGFPGYWLGREPYTEAPTSRLQREFFLVGNVAQGANYATPGDIPQYRAQNYAWAYTVSADATTLTTFDGYLANTNANFLVYASVPNLSTYQNWVQSDQNVSNNTWSIEAASSTLEQYAGPIWMRTRRFVKAQ